jgi:nitrite reductase/ring-hydroxylating ferredoxin subunit
MTESWKRVAQVDEIAPGSAKAVRLDDSGRSVALFNDEGRIYATDNQCPHMGYPLTRGVVRNGVVTCDWHGRRFDLEGGGCFHNMCDDLTVFPVDVRGGGEVWIQVEDSGYQRKDVHLELLREGLLQRDRWTISKALALLSRGGVPQAEIVAVVLRHFGRHVASSRGSEAGTDLARLVGGLTVAEAYDGADHLACLATAATSAAGEAADRLQVVPLPEPVSQEGIEGWVRVFSRNGQANRIERCLFTSHDRGDTERILPLLFECAVQPGFLGFSDNLQTLAYLAEVVDRFGWEASSELVLNLGSKTVGQRRGEPELFRRDAIRKMQSLGDAIDRAAHTPGASTEFDEDTLVADLLSADLDRSFEAVAGALDAGVSLQRLITTMVLVAADRMARTPVNVDAGWSCLTQELNLARSLRTALRIGGPRVAAMGLFHVAWQLFADRWLNIPARPLSQVPQAPPLSATSSSAGMEQVADAVQVLDVHAAGERAAAYLAAGFDGAELLRRLGTLILWNDTGAALLPSLRTVVDEYAHTTGTEAALGAGHPAALQLVAGLARYATDVRTNKASGAATTTALRFAEGLTTIDVFADEVSAEGGK